MIISNKKIIIILIVIVIIYYIIQYNIYTSANIINKLLDYFCLDPPILDPADFEWTQQFRSNWIGIKNEYIDYIDYSALRAKKVINCIL